MSLSSALGPNQVRRASLFVPKLDRLFVAERAGLPGSRAATLVLRPQEDRTN